MNNDLIDVFSNRSENLTDEDKYSMVTFREFVEEQDFVEFVINEFSNTPVQNGPKPWSAKKPQILQTWQNLRPDQPIYMTPMSKQGTGGESHSYGEDGIRITGSWNFIASVMGRIKDIMAYENPHSKLRLVLRGVDKNKGNPNRNSFVFYVNLENRSKGKAGRPSTQPTT